MNEQNDNTPSADTNATPTTELGSTSNNDNNRNFFQQKI
jgi:hypothetical protein